MFSGDGGHKFMTQIVEMEPREDVSVTGFIVWSGGVGIGYLGFVLHASTTGWHLPNPWFASLERPSKNTFTKAKLVVSRIDQFLHEIYKPAEQLHPHTETSTPCKFSPSV